MDKEIQFNSERKRRKNRKIYCLVKITKHKIKIKRQVKWNKIRRKTQKETSIDIKKQYQKKKFKYKKNYKKQIDNIMKIISMPKRKWMLKKKNWFHI